MRHTRTARRISLDLCDTLARQGHSRTAPGATCATLSHGRTRSVTLAKPHDRTRPVRRPRRLSASPATASQARGLYQMIHTFLSDAFLIYVYSRGCKIGEDDRPRISICHFMKIAIIIIISFLSSSLSYYYHGNCGGWLAMLVGHEVEIRSIGASWSRYTRWWWYLHHHLIVIDSIIISSYRHR